MSARVCLASTVLTARHGLNLKMSATVFSSQVGSPVQYFFSKMSSCLRPLSSRVLPSSGQWSKFGYRLPFPSHFLQPGVQPLENQKHDWPLLQRSVPLVQRQLYGSIVPVMGGCPWDHAATSLSIELRARGITMEPWASAPTAKRAARARSWTQI